MRLPGGPRYWTFVTLALLFLPVYIQFAAAVFAALARRNRLAVADAFESFLSAHVSLLLGIVFLLHHTLLSLDAIVRTMVRRFVTGKRLLEWETAAQAEQGRNKRTPVESYLRYCPLIAAVVAGLVALVNPPSLKFALLLLALWASGEAWAFWLDRPAAGAANTIDPNSTAFLRRLSLLTWRYFAEFSTAEDNWLIPDNVEEKDLHVARRVSPTNLGLLLNARQAAQRLGFLTVPEFIQLSQATLDSLERMEKFCGHLMNWYDTGSLAPLLPRIVSSVDSGNLLASLITLAQGSRALLNESLMPRSLETARTEIESEASGSKDAWWLAQLAERENAIQQVHEKFFPWLDPALQQLLQIVKAPTVPAETLTPNSAPSFCRQLDQNLANAAAIVPDGAAIYEQVLPLRLRLKTAHDNFLRLREQLLEIADRAIRLADAMDFAMLLHPVRKLLSIAYNVDKGRIEDACYDLLASEARTAVFLAIAQGDAPQESWFRLGRAHVAGFRHRSSFRGPARCLNI